MGNTINGLPRWLARAGVAVHHQHLMPGRALSYFEKKFTPSNVRALWAARDDARIEMHHHRARQIALLQSGGDAALYASKMARWSALESADDVEAEYVRAGQAVRESGSDTRTYAHDCYLKIIDTLTRSKFFLASGEPDSHQSERRAIALTQSRVAAFQDKDRASEQALADLLSGRSRPTLQKEKSKQQEQAELDGLMSWLNDEEPDKTVRIEESPAISRKVVIHSAPDKPLKAGAGDEEARHKLRQTLATKKEIGPAQCEHQVDEISSQAYVEAPWHAEALSWIRDRHHEAVQNAEKCTKFPPLMLIGPPGCGKTFLMTRLSELLGLPSVRMDMSSSLEPWPVAGGAWGWRNAHPGIAVKTVLKTGYANPLILLDEIEKAGQSHHHGGPLNALLPLLQPETAATYRCPYVEAEVDLSRVSWMMLGNSMNGIPAPLRDRVTVIEVRGPRGHEIRHLAQRLLGDLAADQRVVDAAAHAVESGRMSLRGLHRLAKEFSALDRRPQLN